MRSRVPFRFALVFVPLAAGLLALSSSGRTPQSFNQIISASHPPPGLLETFLSRPGGTDREVQFEGTLSGSTTRAAFHAVVAWDPGHPNDKAKGLLIAIEEAPHVTTLYLDDDQDAGKHFDNLREFEDSLAKLAALSKQQVLHSRRTWNPEGNDWRLEVNFQNRPGTQPAYCCPRFTALSIGFYGEAGEEISGVSISSPTPPEPPYQLDSSRIHRFPGATLGSVIDILKKTRTFLNAH